MPLLLYNTLAKKEEPFVPLEPGKVTMYTCGPTVYGRPHIGNYASFLMADLLRRWLEVSGYEVTHVKNITDVGHLVADQDQGEDKIEKQAKEEKTDPLSIARKYTKQYFEDEEALNMLEPFARPRASETIPQMIAMIHTLLGNGHAYETSDGVYFAVETFPQYGGLSGNTLANLAVGARIKVNEEKRHPADFALWKKTVGENARHVLRWPSPWGEGFPGWHIECSAMSRAFLGESIDIHTGGEDNIFPHHECEIAQSECSGARPFVRFWIHRRRIDMGDVKMSKSLGNILTIPNIIAEGYDPLDLRYLLLSVHCRTPLKFTWKNLDDARKARRKIIEWMEELEHGWVPNDRWREDAISAIEVSGWEQKFSRAMDADLNTSEALSVVFDSMSYSRSQKDRIDSSGLSELHDLLAKVRQTFGCFEAEGELDIPPDIQSLLDERSLARSVKDFALSDRLRREISARGFRVKDTNDGQKITPV
ncbi:cysteine--tRNA ligase [Candidatus Peregrinibacteria bacterium]|nr:cysteine--tRNA ligase [Candidatus Peregrinibacteria bacterium]MBI3817028.1 cysteine--tRNA ligase [Candidatus Peregrinibacteria bacterium]